MSSNLLLGLSKHSLNLLEDFFGSQISSLHCFRVLKLPGPDQNSVKIDPRLFFGLFSEFSPNRLSEVR